MNTTTEQDNRLEEVGKCALASIVEMVAAMECDYDRLEELRSERDEWVANDGGDDDEQNRTLAEWAQEFPDESSELAELEYAAGDCESSEDARDRIMEGPLELTFRSGWVSSKEDMEPDEFMLLLSTGGPATRIMGEIENGEASRAWLEVQDWFVPWTQHYAAGDAADAILKYAQCFCMES